MSNQPKHLWLISTGNENAKLSWTWPSRRKTEVQKAPSRKKQAGACINNHLISDTAPTFQRWRAPPSSSCFPASLVGSLSSRKAAPSKAPIHPSAPLSCSRRREKARGGASGAAEEVRELKRDQKKGRFFFFLRFWLGQEDLREREWPRGGGSSCCSSCASSLGRGSLPPTPTHRMVCMLALKSQGFSAFPSLFLFS